MLKALMLARTGKSPFMYLTIRSEHIHIFLLFLNDKKKKSICFKLKKRDKKKETSFLSRKNTPMNCQLKPSYYSPVLHFFQVVLSACSSYFQKLLIENPCKHPTIIMPQDVCFTDLRFIIEFVYRGEIDVSQSELQSLLRTADQLKIKGMFY